MAICFLSRCELSSLDMLEHETSLQDEIYRFEMSFFEACMLSGVTKQLITLLSLGHAE